MFSTSAVIFIKCRNRYHMKNNIRYKGNINITFVIIFLKSQKLPAMLLCLGEPPVRFFSYLHFIFDLHFVVFISFLMLCLHFVVGTSFVDILHFVVVHSHFLFDVIPHPFVDYRQGFYTPFYTFSPAHHGVICDTFIFDHSILPRALQP